MLAKSWAAIDLHQLEVLTNLWWKRFLQIYSQPQSLMLHVCPAMNGIMPQCFL